MEDYPFYPHVPYRYDTFNDKFRYNKKVPHKLISANSRGEVEVRPLWRLELLAKYYGVDICDYEDRTNYEYYEELIWNCHSSEEREEVENSVYQPDSYDDYFEILALFAAKMGLERTEIKCLVKSLLLKYRHIKQIDEFPHEAFNKLYNRLISSRDVEQLRVARRLSRYHIKEFEIFLAYTNTHANFKW